MKCVVPLIIVPLLFSTLASAEVPLLENGKPRVQIVADVRGATPAGTAVLKDVTDWLAESLNRASGAQFELANEPGDQPALIVARTDQWPDIAREAGLTTQKYDDYTIATRPEQRRIYVLGNSEEAAGFGVADLLRRWGFRCLA